ncbi:MAG: cytochrome C, partial [Candidatus Lutacidiplasmatales archaeon]
LLAVVFIFTIHFFNGHLRPEKFPMDTVIFTGTVTAHELEEERPAEWERLNAEGRLKELEVDYAHDLAKAGKVVGTVAVSLGLVLVVLALYGLFLGE